MGGKTVTVQTLPGSSAHFDYKYEDTLNGAQQRVLALQASCENDLQELEATFAATGGFDGGNRCTVEVNNPAKGGLASNGGYQTGGATRIVINPWSTVTSSATADDGARLEFVAEMVEILMGLRNKRQGTTNWNPGGSNGEGLSQVCAATFYPAAYYDSQLKHGPGRITSWLNDATRPDWVTKTDPSDTNDVTYGCASLFTYFLVTQKGFSLHDVITKGGPDLEATFKNLTGSGGGWNEFKALLDRFFPTGHSYSPPSCDIFPLYDDNRRSVVISFAPKSHGLPSILPGGDPVKVKPCLLRPPRDYTYEWVMPNVELVCTTSMRGFGNPVVTWTVDAVTLPATDVEFTVAGEVDVDQPDQPYQPISTTETFDLTASAQKDVSTYQGHAVSRSISPVGHPGQERLTITVGVTEQFATPAVPAYDVYTWERVTTRFVSYEPAFYRDKEECDAALRDLMHRYLKFKHINILLTLPDPPSEVISLAHALDRTRTELAELVTEDQKAARQAAVMIARALRLDPNSFAAGIPGLEDLGSEVD
jgi:hypothetical protein